MTDVELKAAIAEAEARARGLAFAFAAVADRSEVDSLRAESARLLIETAEIKAAHLHRDEVNERMAELLAWGGNIEETITSAALSQPSEHLQSEALNQGVAHAAASLDARQAGMMKWLREHPLRVWLKACDELQTFNKPFGSLAEGSDRVQ